MFAATRAVSGTAGGGCSAGCIGWSTTGGGVGGGGPRSLSVVVVTGVTEVLKDPFELTTAGAAWRSSDV